MTTTLTRVAGSRSARAARARRSPAAVSPASASARHGLVGEARDVLLERGERAGVDDHLLHARHLLGRHPRNADEVEHRCAGSAVARSTARASSGVGLPSTRSPPTGLPVTAVFAERTHHVVAHLEGVAERQPVRAERRQEVARHARARPSPRRGAAAARSCTCRSCSGRSARPDRRRRSWRTLPRMSRNWPMLSSTRSSFHRSHASGGAPRISRSAYTKARSPTRIATPSPNRRASPAQPCRSWSAANTVCVVGEPRRLAASSITSSWNSANACISSNAAPASTTASAVGVAARADAAPVAERRPQPLAAGEDQALDLVHRRGEVLVERRPPLPLRRQQLVEARLHPAGDAGERRRGREGGQHGFRVGRSGASVPQRARPSRVTPVRVAVRGAPTRAVAPSIRAVNRDRRRGRRPPRRSAPGPARSAPGRTRSARRHVAPAPPGDRRPRRTAPAPTRIASSSRCAAAYPSAAGRAAGPPSVMIRSPRRSAGASRQARRSRRRYCALGRGRRW